MRQRSAVLLAPLLLLGCQSGSSSDQPPTSTVEGTPFSLNVLETRACPLPAGIDAKEARIVGVKVELRADHPGRVGANYFYGSLVTRSGKRYLAELAGCEPVLSHAPLAPGQQAEGFLNFPLPTTEVPVTVVYAPNLDRTLGSEALSIRALSQEVELP